MKILKLAWPLTLLFLLFITSVSLNATAQEQNFSEEKFSTEKVEGEKLSEEKITTKIIVENGHVSNLPIKIGDVPELPEGTALTDIPFLACDKSLFAEYLGNEITALDSNGCPRMTNTYHKYAADEPGEEDAKPIIDGMHCPGDDPSTGYFILYFEDQEVNDGQGNGEGYDHPEYGEARREAACEAARRVANTIDMNGTTPELQFQQNPANTNGSPLPPAALAGAVTYFPAENGFHGGHVWQHITTGEDPDPGTGNFDATVATNFNETIPWSTDQINGLSYDLVTVLTHEIIHTLGFLSRIPGIITQEHIDGINMNVSYTNFDKFLYANEQSSTPLLIPATSAFTNVTYTGDPGSPSPQTISNQVVFKRDPTVLDESRPVFSEPVPPSVWAEGTSMDHLDKTRAPGHDYIMHPYINKDESQDITGHEKEVLCMIGYGLQNFDCANRAPIAVDDDDLSEYETPMGTEICIDFTDSSYDDFDPDDPENPEAFSLHSVDVLYGGNEGSLTYWDAIDPATGLPVTTLPLDAPRVSVICYTPEDMFWGIAWLRYTLFDGSTQSNIADIKINVVPDGCVSDPGNYVCNGDFEQGLPGYHEMNSCPSTTPFWCPVRQTTPNHMDRLDNFWYWDGYGVGTASGTPNDRYIMARKGHSPDNWQHEGLYSKLIRSLDPSQEYELSFLYHHNAKQDFNSSPNQPVVYLSDIEPEHSVPGIYTPPASAQHLLTGDMSSTNSWKAYSARFFPASADHVYLVVVPQSDTGVPDALYGLDDVAVRKTDASGSNVDIQVTSTAAQSDPVAGTILNYKVRVKNLGPARATNILIDNYLPEPLYHLNHTTQAEHPWVLADGFADNIVSWQIEKLNPNEHIDLYIEASFLWPTTCDRLRNVAIMTAVDQDDPYPFNHFVDPYSLNFPDNPIVDQFIGTHDIQPLCRGTISGRVFHDLNANGTRDPGEPGLANSMPIELYQAIPGTDEIITPAAASTYSNINPTDPGYYEFTNIQFGRYYVKINIPAVWQQTSPQEGTVTINGDNRLHYIFVNSLTYEDKDFGLIPPTPTTDIQVLKKANVTATDIGDTITYRITVKNLGPDNVTDISLIDHYTSGLVSVDFSLSGPTASFNPEIDQQTGLLTIPQLNAGETVVLTWRTRTDSVLCGKEKVRNTVTLQEGLYTDTQVYNNTSFVDVRLRGCDRFDIELKKSVERVRDLGSVQYITYKILATNLGPDTAGDVVIQDLIPEGSGYIDHETVDGSSQINFLTGELTWDIPALPAAQTARLSLTVKRVRTTPLSNTVKLIDTNGIDLNDQNNTATHFLPPAN